MKNILSSGLILFCCAILTACTYMRETDMRDEFDKSMKSYNKMLRWQEVESAGMLYMEPEQRDTFMSAAETMKKRGVNITDYRILTSECLPEKSSAEVVAEFDYYALPSNRIKTVTYRQNWAYREINAKKSWKVKTGLPVFE